MPELPEVELCREDLTLWTADSPSLRLKIWDRSLLSEEAEERLNTTLPSENGPTWKRKGKILLWSLSPDCAVAVHLRMTGKFIMRSQKLPPRHTRASLLGGALGSIHFTDPRRFARWWWGSEDEVREVSGWNRLGPDAWLQMPQSTYLAEAWQRTRKTLHAAMQDQSTLAGIGNIIATESCFDAGILPTTPARMLSSSTLDTLRGGIQRTIQRSLERDRGKEIHYQGERGAENPFQVYGKAGEKCPKCAAMIRSEKLSGRTAFWCPGCQRREP